MKINFFRFVIKNKKPINFAWIKITNSAIKYFPLSESEIYSDLVRYTNFFIRSVSGGGGKGVIEQSDPVTVYDDNKIENILLV